MAMERASASFSSDRFLQPVKTDVTSFRFRANFYRFSRGDGVRFFPFSEETRIANEIVDAFRNDQCVYLLLSSPFALVFAACKKNPRLLAPHAQEVARATPAPSSTPIPKPVNLKSEVIVLCYHRFDDKPKNSLAIKPVDFEAQMHPQSS